MLSETEYGVFSTRIKGPKLDTRRSKVICPVPSETQGSVGHQLPGAETRHTRHGPENVASNNCPSQYKRAEAAMGRALG